MPLQDFNLAMFVYLGLVPKEWEPVLPAAGVAVGLWGGTLLAWAYYRWKRR